MIKADPVVGELVLVWILGRPLKGFFGVWKSPGTVDFLGDWVKSVGLDESHCKGKWDALGVLCNEVDGGVALEVMVVVRFGDGFRVFLVERAHENCRLLGE
jgi:hypothetical protein